jgi:hypothetical protein
MTAGPLFGGGLTHLVCAATGHACAKVPILTKCCCGDHRDVSAPATTTTDRNDILAAGAVDAVTLAATLSTVVRQLPRAADASPPLLHLTDRPVLFSDLRL